MKVSLKNISTANSALAECVSNTVESAVANHHRTPTPHYIHILRVTCKRMRAYLRLVRPHMKKSAYRRENRFLRDANRTLSGTRDSHVLKDTLHLVCPQGTPPFTHERLEPIEKALTPAAENKDVTRQLQAAEDALREFSERFRSLYPKKINGWKLLKKGFSITFEQSADACRDCLKSRKPEDFHEWRKVIKYLRFQTELLLDSEQLIIPGMYNSLIDLERSLGKHHDLFLLAREVGKLKNTPGPDPEVIESVVYAVGRESEQCEKEILQIGQRLFVSEGHDLLVILDDQLK
jgi:CHAD domain-containing protein